MSSMGVDGLAIRLENSIVMMRTSMMKTKMTRKMMKTTSAKWDTLNATTDLAFDESLILLSVVLLSTRLRQI